MKKENSHLETLADNQKAERGYLSMLAEQAAGTAEHTPEQLDAAAVAEYGAVPVVVEYPEAELDVIFGKDSRPKLTAAQVRFTYMDRHYQNEIKPFLDDLKAARAAVVEESGLGVFFQDRDGVVYKTDECEGKFVYFEPHQIKRTRREGEEKGSLSMKEAREAGFIVEGK